ncbi:MAG: Gfo/Idh/MocA family oxidoreductase [Legionellaceae bacterium]|nr:Gfo/Idh/MocA family oxidoreductase [Legionellaceae bacterium]
MFFSPATKKRRVVIIGASGKKGGDYITAVTKRDDLEIVAVVINTRVSPLVSHLESQGVIIIRDGQIDELLAHVNFDIAIVSVPHAEHKAMTLALLDAKKYVVKEKPLAMSMKDIERYESICHTQNIPPVFTTVQRDSLPVFLKAKEDLPLIGQPTHFTYNYWFNLPSVTTGWRAHMETAGGGVILDMGYHAINVLINFFGQPDRMAVSFAYAHQETEQEGLEDYARFFLGYEAKTEGEDDLRGLLILDRHADTKKEIFKIHGSNGHMIIDPQGYQIFDLSDTLIKHAPFERSKELETDQMLQDAIPRVMDKNALNQAYIKNKHTVDMIEKVYQCKGNQRHVFFKPMGDAVLSTPVISSTVTPNFS